MTIILGLNGYEVRCKLARTQTELTIGLQRHASLAPDEGMLFVLGRTRTATFHMGQVRFPIDLVGLDADSRVTKVVEGALPGSLERWTFSKVAAVLEVPAGTCRAAKVRTGVLVTCRDTPEHVQNMRVSPLDGNTQRVTAQSMPPEFDSFDTDDVSGDQVTPEDPAQRLADPELKEGQRFKVGRFGPTWVVVRTHGMTGYVQREGHKRKWFGYSHNRDTGEVAVYPVKQGSGDRIGDPVAFGPLNLLDVEKTARRGDLLEQEDAQLDESLEDHAPHVSTKPGGKAFDAPKEEYFSDLWGDQLANEALDVNTSLQTRIGEAFHGTPFSFVKLNHGRSGLGSHFGTYNAAASRLKDRVKSRNAPKGRIIQYELDIRNPLQLPDIISWEDPLFVASAVARKLVTPDKFEEMYHHLSKSFDEIRAFLERHGYDSIAYRNSVEAPGSTSYIVWRDNQIHAKGQEFYTKHDELFQTKTTDLPVHKDLTEDIDITEDLNVVDRDKTLDLSKQSARGKKAQIVDEQKFVEKAANILFSHADRIPWQQDALNGGATERAVVTRTELTAWLSGDQETGQGAAAPEAVQHLAEAASNDRGLRLLGTAFVLAELADFTRLGFSGRQPTLVLYRQTPEVTS